MIHKGIEYRPDIQYQLKDAQANEYIEEILEIDKYISPDEVSTIVEENIINLDYLLEYIENELKDSSFNNITFAQYQPLAVKSTIANHHVQMKRNKLFMILRVVSEG